MEKLFILIVSGLGGDGVITHNATGPFDEHSCRVREYEIIRLAATNSKPHALIAQCRELSDEAARQIFKAIKDAENATRQQKSVT